MTNGERKGEVGGGGEGISTYIHKEVLYYKMRALMAGNV